MSIKEPHSKLIVTKVDKALTESKWEEIEKTNVKDRKPFQMDAEFMESAARVREIVEREEREGRSHT